MARKGPKEEAEAKQAQARATSGEFAATVIDKPISTPDGLHGRPKPTSQFPQSLRSSRSLRPHEAKSQTRKARLTRWLEKIRRASGDFQRSRARDAIYGYLEAVFAIVMHYKVRRRTARLLQHAFKFADCPFDSNADFFSAVIRCTCGGDVDSKAISKWARALRYAARRKEHDMRLQIFMKSVGGLNACAKLYAKYFGRGQSR